MAVICLTSASGSPGVTATAVGLAFCWPRPVLLVEADPTGGSGILAGFMKGTTPYDIGLVELALSPLSTADALRDVVRPLNPSVSLVAGTRTHAQAAALRDVWEPLGSALHELEASGQDVIVKVDVQGAVTIKGIVPGAVFIFLAPPSMQDLISRLQQRGTEAEEDLDRRIKTAGEEMETLPSFDYVVINRQGELDLAVADIKAIYRAEKCRVKPREISL